MDNAARKSVCVFCGSADGTNPEYLTAARAAGAVMATEGVDLVYGAGPVGLMNAVAEGVLGVGGRVTGVITRVLASKEQGRRSDLDLRIVETMHERKAEMARLADGFVVLPGGLGTYEEFFEVLTWAQLGIHSKRIAILDIDDFFGPLFEMLDHSVAAGFVAPRDQELASRVSTMGEALGMIYGTRTRGQSVGELRERAGRADGEGPASWDSDNDRVGLSA